MSNRDYIIRPATEADAGAAFELIRELAEFENWLDKVTNTKEQFIKDGFGESPIYRLLVAEAGDAKIVGIALFNITYSTWRGKMLFLDDLIVTKDRRGSGIGKMLVDALFRIAQDEQVKIVKWQVLDWNTPAIAFYKKLGAVIDPEWIDCKFSEKEIALYPFS